LQKKKKKKKKLQKKKSPQILPISSNREHEERKQMRFEQTNLLSNFAFKLSKRYNVRNKRMRRSQKEDTE
jgi:hypothetical protein